MLDPQFVTEAPNQRWVGDTTEFLIGESQKLYLAAVLDLYSRVIVGWAVSAVNDRRLTLKAVDMALQRRSPRVVCCITPTAAAPNRRLPSGADRPQHRLQHESSR